MLTVPPSEGEVAPDGTGSESPSWLADPLPDVLSGSPWLMKRSNRKAHLRSKAQIHLT